MDRHRVRRRPVLGQVLAPAEGRRGLFGQWQRALGLEEVTEIPSAAGTPVYLHARGVRGGVAVSVTATVFDDGRRPVSDPVAGVHPPGSAGLFRPAGKLMAAVRPEFRADVPIFAPGDPVFGPGSLPGPAVRASRKAVRRVPLRQPLRPVG